MIVAWPTDSCYSVKQVDGTFLQGHSNAGLKVIGAPAQKISLPDVAKAALQCRADE